jgi:Asp-tRNA(Asn)/Glu-tRNA(Gln) amidotransferase A subunit family amidase
MPRATLTTLLLALITVCSCNRQRQAGNPERIDADLMEVTIPRLRQLYADRTYSVSDVVRWYLARIEKYNGMYRAVQTVAAKGALATAERLDAEARAGSGSRGPLWGVPIVLKANTSVQGLVTTDGWKGYTLPGHELVAPRDATIAAKLRTAGAVILGQTNMPDFAASDTNRSTAYGRTGNAYDIRFSPGGSSGGTVTAVTANMAVFGNGTDTGNSIRMPAATSSVVGLFPTRGLVSIAGIAPMDWLLDNTGPITRTVTDAAIVLDVITGEDAGDARTLGSAASAQHGPYTNYLKTDALKGKRFGVPAFIPAGAGIPFEGVPTFASPSQFKTAREKAGLPLRPETRELFLKSLDGMRAAGAEIVFDESVLPESFAETCSHVATFPWVREGTEKFLAGYGPAQYHSSADYQKATGAPLPDTIIGGPNGPGAEYRQPFTAKPFDADPQAEINVLAPRRKALAMYADTLDRFHLDGYIYPGTQMPPPDETMPQDGKISEGPHSDTSWVNMLGVPAIVVPGGFYPSGLPFGLELSTRPWKDGDLLGWAYAYEQATHHRRPPVLVERGLLR